MIHPEDRESVFRIAEEALLGGIRPDAEHRIRQVSEMLFISEETVKIHMKHVLDKLGASHRTQAVAIAMSRGIIQMG
jgi:hypothetical protein